MSQMEWFLIIAGIVIAVITFLFVFLKKEKKEKSQPKTTEYVRETKPEGPVSAETPAPKQEPKQVKPPVYVDTDDDFKQYLELRKKRIEAAEPKGESFVRNPDGDYVPARLRARLNKNKEEKTLSEQINELSPELKALILSGVLDKKF